MYHIVQSEMLRPLVDPKRKLKSLIPESIRNRIQYRPFIAFGVGAEKSGTTALSSMFEATHRVGHEPLWGESIHHMFQYFRGRLSREALVAYFHERDRYLRLSLESSCFLAWHTDILLDLFPESKFILTLRSARPWLRSDINEHMKSREHGLGLEMHQWYTLAFRPHEFKYTPHDMPLLARGLPPIDSFLNYWVEAIERPLNVIPEKQLLVLRTEELSASTYRLAGFLGLPSTDVESHPSNRNRQAKDYGVFDELDPKYVSDRCEAICGRLMDRYYPSSQPEVATTPNIIPSVESRETRTNSQAV